MYVGFIDPFAGTDLMFGTKYSATCQPPQYMINEQHLLSNTNFISHIGNKWLKNHSFAYILL